VKGHLREEGVDIVQGEESFSTKEFGNDWYNTRGEIGRDWRILFLFFVEIRECSVSRAKRSNILGNVWNVLWILAEYEIPDQGMEIEASFRDGFGGNDNLFLVESSRELDDTGSGDAGGRNILKIKVLVEFEGFTFVLVSNVE
jgi:hypothetical protein